MPYERCHPKTNRDGLGVSSAQTAGPSFDGPQPRLRFLPADDPCAGKAIMAGLLHKQMKLREGIERVLILYVKLPHLGRSRKKGR